MTSVRLLVAMLVAALALAATAGAATTKPRSRGSVTIATGGVAVTALKSAKVTTSAVKPATYSARTRKLTLPVTGGSVSARTSTIDLGGALRLRTGRRTLTLTRPRLVVGGSAPSISALIGKARTTIFTISGAKPKVDVATGSVDLKGAKLRLGARAAATIAAKLKLRRAPTGAFGSATVAARIPPTIQTTTTSGPTSDTTAPSPGSGSSGPGSSGSGGAPTSQPQSSCRQAVTHVAPTLLGDPGGTTTVSGATLDWHVRESFTTYVASEGGSSTAVSGATDAGGGTFRFAAAASGSWKTAGGVAQLRFTGGVRFVFPGRFDTVYSDPIVELNGAASRLIMTVTESGQTAVRRVITTFANPVAPFAQMPGLAPAGADGAELMDSYCPGEQWGWSTVTGL